MSICVLVCFVILLSCESEEHQESPPNIVLFLVDDMGWQDTSVSFWTEPTPFNERYHTPNTERLASQGMLFTPAYATPGLFAHPYQYYDGNERGPPSG